MVSRSLPDDMMEEILFRLPVKSILRFKCTCKKWYAKISDPPFARRCSESLSSPCSSWGLLLQRESNIERCPLTHFIPETSSHLESHVPNPPHVFLDFLPLPIAFVVATSKDLVMCSATQYFQTLYYISNPTTRKWAALPPPPHKKFKTVSVTFTYENERDLMVVRSFPDYDSYHHIKIDTYSSCSRRWTPPRKISFPCFLFSLFRGTLYCFDMFKPPYILAYNLTKRRSFSIALPGDKQYRAIKGRVGVYKDEQLRFMEFNYARFSFCVWTLEDSEKGEWSLEYSIDFQSMLAQNPWILFERERQEDFMRYEDDSVHSTTEIRGNGLYVHQEPPNHGSFILNLLAFHPFNQHVVILRVQSRILSFNFISKRMENNPGLPSFGSVVFPYLRSLPQSPTRIPPLLEDSGDNLGLLSQFFQRLVRRHRRWLQ